MVAQITRGGEVGRLAIFVAAIARNSLRAREGCLELPYIFSVEGK